MQAEIPAPAAPVNNVRAYRMRRPRLIVALIRGEPFFIELRGSKLENIAVKVIDLKEVEP